MTSPGKLFRKLMGEHPPLQVVGTINAYSAMLAKEAGCQAIYLSGAGVANASYGLPDLGMTNLSEVVEDASRITAACDLPLLVDIDTGFGNEFGIHRTIRRLERAGVAGVHLEDQVVEKRCGHRPGKQIVSTEEMEDRLKAALDARQDPNFVIIARTDAYEKEGLAGTIARVKRYQAMGADLVFLEALPDLDAFIQCHRAFSLPILANATEFGKTPLYSREAYQQAGVSVILYPLSAFRAMSQAASAVYKAIVEQGTQAGQIAQMQTREALYQVLHYYDYEK
jgi:methylisocitrate lyase